MSQLVCLTSGEWKNLCSNGSVRLAPSRAIDDAETPKGRNRFALFSRAPNTFAVGESADFIIAEIRDSWKEVWWSFEGRAVKDYACLQLRDVLDFFPVQEKDRWQFESDSAKAEVRLSAARLESEWLLWSEEEAIRQAVSDGVRFLQLFELAENWQQWPQKSFWKDLAVVALDPGRLQSVGRPAREAAKPVGMRTQLYDACRQDVDTGAFLVSCPFEFANAATGPKLSKRSPGLEAELVALHTEMQQMAYGPDAFRHELVLNFFARITSLAPKAYSGSWRPAGTVIYIRYFHRIQFGKVDPDELVRDFRLLVDVEGAKSARVVGFLLAIALGPARIQSLARKLQPDSYAVAVVSQPTASDSGIERTPARDVSRATITGE